MRRAAVRPNSSTPWPRKPPTDRGQLPLQHLLHKICDRAFAGLSGSIAPAYRESTSVERGCSRIRRDGSAGAGQTSARAPQRHAALRRFFWQGPIEYPFLQKLSEVRYCEHGSLKNKGFRGQYGRGFVSRATAIAPVERCPRRRDTVQCAAGRRWPAARSGGVLSPTRGGRGHVVPRLDLRWPAAAEARVAWASDAPHHGDRRHGKTP